MGKTVKLAILHSHPIQYFAPLYARIAQEPDIDLTVYYCSRQGVDEYHDEGFGHQLKWDVPLLEGYRYQFLPNVRHRDQVSGFLSLINPSIVRELRREKPDALWVNGHNYFTYLLAIGAAKAFGIPVLMRGETHLLLSCSMSKRVLRRLVMSMFYQVCDACLPIGTRNAEFYRSHGVQDDRLFIVPYAVDNKFFTQTAESYLKEAPSIKKELGLPANTPLILFASKLMPRKRPMDLLMAYHRLRSEQIQAALVFIGSGSHEKMLKTYIEQQQVPDVYFFGFRNQSELPKFYAIADIFVLPSENEPWGLVVNEVMCAGLPVIATKEIGAAADLVVPGHNGLIFQTGDIEMLVSHLRTLATDSELRMRMGQRSRELIAKWSIERCVRGVKEALFYLTSKSSNGRKSETRFHINAPVD